jgi:putative oxidoreductase
VNNLNLGLFVIRVFFGVSMAYHGYNKVFGGGGLKGTAGWFESMGMRWPAIQARVAAFTEIGAGLMFAAGLLTPLAAAGLIGLMVVAIYTSHLKNGFFIFNPGSGWEYCGSIAAAAFGVGAIGAGEWSLDEAFDIHMTGWNGWMGAAVAGVVGVGGAGAQLAVSYRPPAKQ